ncbi:protein JTB [Heptranchias perlo]|uniref:protein JTB n=1 Tax=Heptranchias perlo TaxID=212740 RepID=UPI003559867F
MLVSCESLESQEGSSIVSRCRDRARTQDSGPRGLLLLLTLIYFFMLNIGLGESRTSSEGKDSVNTITATPCWQVEQFVVAEECQKCTLFEAKTQGACIRTGFVEKINCPESNKEEYKSCRSVLVEETLFWKFEGAVMSLSLVFAVLVILRQRALDRLASEKVRKQIESI